MGDATTPDAWSATLDAATADDWRAYADDLDAGRDTYTEPEADELAALIAYGD